MSIFKEIRDRIAGNKPIEAADQQPEDVKKLVSFVKRKLDESRNSPNRVASEGIWMSNIAYLCGFDGMSYDTRTRSFVPLAGGITIQKNRLRSNRLLPMAQNRLARLMKVPPRFETIPNDNTEEAKEAALLGMDVLVDGWQRESVNKKRLNMGMWMQQCGHAYFKVSYDAFGGEKMLDPSTNEMAYEGKPRIDVASAFEIFPDPLATDLTEDECGYVIHAKIRPVDYFKRYGESGKLVKPEGNWLQSLRYEQQINSVSPMTAGASQENSTSTNAIEISYYERPSFEHENGRHIIIANDVLLKDDELIDGMYPFAKFDDIMIGGKYNPESCITHAKPLQDQRNETLSRRAEWTRKLLAGKYLAAKGHGLAKEALNDRTEVVEYNPVPGAAEPGAMQIPTMPEYAYRETDQLDKEIADIFGLSEVSQGKIPSAGIPAIGMQLLLEQDETRIGVETEQHEHAYARLGTIYLKYVEKCCKTKRKLRKRDSNGNYSIREYSGDDLKGNTAVLVVRGSTVPTSQALRRQEIMNTYQQGLMGDPADPAVRQNVMQKLEFGDSTGMWEKYTATMKQIKRTLQDIETGVVTEETAIASVSQYDDHILFLQKLNDYRIGDKYDSLPPEQKLTLLAVMDAHLEWQARISNPGIAVPPKAPMDLGEEIDQEASEVEAQMPPPPPEGAPPPNDAPLAAEAN